MYVATIHGVSDVAALTQKLAELERLFAQQAAELAELRQLVASQRMAFDAPAPAVTLTQRTKYTFTAQLARPRVLIGFEAHNTATGARISCAHFTAAQLERHAFRFARLTQPTRSAWRGDTRAYALMRQLFAQHGAIAVTHGRRWSWTVWPPERRQIAARIAAAVR